MKKNFILKCLSCTLTFSVLFSACGKKEQTSDNVFAGAKEGNESTVQSTEESDSSDVTNPQAANTATPQNDAHFLTDSWYPFGALIYDYDSPDVSGILVETDTHLNAASVYDKINYTEKYFYGTYLQSHPDKTSHFNATREFMDNNTWYPYEEIFGNVQAKIGSNNHEVIPVPFMIKAGPVELNNGLYADNTKEWCEISFPSRYSADSEGFVTFYACYTVNGNTITFQLVDEYETDYDNNQISYTLSDVFLSYQFQFEGLSLTLSNEECSSKMYSYEFILDDSDNYSFSFYYNHADPQKKLDEISGFYWELGLDLDDNNRILGNFHIEEDHGDTFPDSCYDAALRYNENGIVQFSYVDKTGATHSYEFVMFCLNNTGVILHDGTNEYVYYSSSYNMNIDYYGELTAIENIREEDQDLYNALSSEQQEELAQTREDLISELSQAFTAEGIDMDFNESTGEMSFNSEILFSVNDYTLSNDGETEIAKFIKVMSDVLSNEKYDNFLSEIEVQGHTDTNGDYDMNMTLSENRAKTVAEFCLDTLKNDSSNYDKFNDLLNPVGYSYDRPIMNADGTVNMEGSRRVVFVFYINLLDL